MLKQDYRRFWIVAFEVQDVAHIRTAPAIDGLIRIPNNTDIPMSLGKQFRDRILRAIRILILIHEDVLKFLLVFLAYFLII